MRVAPGRVARQRSSAASQDLLGAPVAGQNRWFVPAILTARAHPRAPAQRSHLAHHDPIVEVPSISFTSAMIRATALKSGVSRFLVPGSHQSSSSAIAAQILPQSRRLSR